MTSSDAGREGEQERDSRPDGHDNDDDDQARQVESPTHLDRVDSSNDDQNGNGGMDDVNAQQRREGDDSRGATDDDDEPAHEAEPRDEMNDATSEPGDIKQNEDVNASSDADRRHSTSTNGSFASAQQPVSSSDHGHGADDQTPTVAHSAQFEAPVDYDSPRTEGGDFVSDLRDSPVQVNGSPRSFRRPFSLVSEPDSPSTSAPASPQQARTPSKQQPRRPSLLTTPLSPASDPTNVGRDSSASLTQAVWRQSMGLNSTPSTIAKGLVDVQLDDCRGSGGTEEEEAEEARRKKRRSAAMSWNSAHAASMLANGHSNGKGTASKLKRASQRRSNSDSHALAAAFEVDEQEINDEASSLSPVSPTRSHSYPLPTVHDRSGSIAAPHAADGFISHRASANLSALAQPVSPANPPSSNSGIRALQANFESLRTLKEREGGEEEEEIDWEFWGKVMSDYEEVAQSQPKELSRAIQRGIPPALRGMTWQLMSAAKDANLEFVYSELLKQTSPHEKSIARDLNRTFPKHAYFKDAEGVGQENLFNVVKAYSIYDDEVGYTQGLQFIVGPLLLNMPDEEAFCVLVRLMKSYDLRSHYTPNMPGLQLRLFQFDRLVEELVPSVFLHLLRQGVKSSMYASQWFLTLFGYRLPLELVSAVFDLVFAEGVEALFRFAVALLKRNEAYLLTLEFEDLIDFLKNGLFEAYAPDERELMQDPDAEYRIHEFVRDALQVRITPMMLDQFGEEWASLCAAQTAHAAELDALRKANHQLSRQVRQLESSLAQINQEHCELVKQVVASRLEREELEDELVKYKLAYADLSHVAAASQASASPVTSRRQSEMSIASVSDESRSTASVASATQASSGLTAGLGSFGGRWFGGSGRGSVSSTMSRSGSQGL